MIGADGEMLGIMSAAEARKLAEEADLDLVKISPGAKPPVCKIIDYGKYKYEKTRKEKDAKKKQHTVEIKEREDQKRERRQEEAAHRRDQGDPYVSQYRHKRSADQDQRC